MTCRECGAPLVFVAVTGPPVPQAAPVLREWTYRCGCPRVWRRTVEGWTTCAVRQSGVSSDVQ